MHLRLLSPSKTTNDFALLTQDGSLQAKMRREKKPHTHRRTSRSFLTFPRWVYSPYIPFARHPNLQFQQGLLSSSCFFKNFRIPFSFLFLTKITPAPRFPPAGLCLSHVSRRRIYFILCSHQLALPFLFSEEAPRICVHLFQLFLQGTKRQSLGPAKQS